MRPVALATCADVAGTDDDDVALLAALERRGLAAEAAAWDAEVDWASYELVVVRSTWDYAERRDAFLAWAQRLPRVLNPPEVLRWNTDKRYLLQLGAAGVPVVPTRFLQPGDVFEPPGERFVVKPAVSAGARNTASYSLDEAAAAREHVAALHAAGRTVMVQPYLERVDERGETALIYVGDAYSHAIRKDALLRPGAPRGDGLYVKEKIDRREPTSDEHALGERVLASLPFCRGNLLYARIDLLPTADGRPSVLEVELTEPSLFLRFSDGAADRLAEAVAEVL